MERGVGLEVWRGVWAWRGGEGRARRAREGDRLGVADLPPREVGDGEQDGHRHRDALAREAVLVVVVVVGGGGSGPEHIAGIEVRYSPYPNPNPERNPGPSPTPSLHPVGVLVEVAPHAGVVVLVYKHRVEPQLLNEGTWGGGGLE